jgi:hypothetical protein
LRPPWSKDGTGRRAQPAARTGTPQGNLAPGVSQESETRVSYYVDTPAKIFWQITPENFDIPAIFTNQYRQYPGLTETYQK